VKGGRRVAVIALMAVLTATVGAPADLDDYVKGETLDYNLTWLHVVGGSMRLSIGPSGIDRLHITSLATTDPTFAKIYKVHDQIESFVLRDSFCTISYEKTLNENGKIKEDDTAIDPVTRNAQRIRGKDKRAFHINPPPPYLDPLSVVYRLRMLDLTPGKVHTFTVYADGNVYSMTAAVRRDRETLQTPAGKFTCVSVEPKMKGRGGLFRDDNSRLIFWYTDDARHIPVKIQSELKFGSITATLRSARSGVTSTGSNTK
jgi:hypothetical protein